MPSICVMRFFIGSSSSSNWPLAFGQTIPEQGGRVKRSVVREQHLRRPHLYLRRNSRTGRVQWLPIPSGRIQPLNALIFAIVLAIISFTLLTVYANLLAACLAMSGIATYVGVYTIWLKRSSTQNIVIGGAAGKAEGTSSGAYLLATVGIRLAG